MQTNSEFQDSKRTKTEYSKCKPKNQAWVEEQKKVCLKYLLYVFVSEKSAPALRQENYVSKDTSLHTFPPVTLSSRI